MFECNLVALKAGGAAFFLADLQAATLASLLARSAFFKASEEEISSWVKNFFSSQIFWRFSLAMRSSESHSLIILVTIQASLSLGNWALYLLYFCLENSRQTLPNAQFLLSFPILNNRLQLQRYEIRNLFISNSDQKLIFATISTKKTLEQFSNSKSNSITLNQLELMNIYQQQKSISFCKVLAMTQQQNWKISSLTSMMSLKLICSSICLFFVMGSTFKILFFLFDLYNLFSRKLIKFWKVKPTIKPYYVIFLRMLKTKTRKLQSNQKLNTKLNYIAQAETSPEFIKKTDSFIIQDRKELQTFNLNKIEANENQDDYASNLNNEKSRSKPNPNIKLQQIQKKVKQREDLRKTKGLAVKMKIKLQDQIKTSKRHLQEKESQLKQIQSEIQMLQNLSKQRAKHSEDIANNQQMLRFKESQFANLNTIHSEILESAKKELAKQKLIKLQNQQKLVSAKKKLKNSRDKWNATQNRLVLIQQLTKEKLRLQKLFEKQKKADQQKLQLKADAIREVVEEIIKKNKRAIQDQCESKSRIIRDKSHGVKNVPDFKLILQKSGVPSSSYYNFSQLKGVKQLNFKIIKQAEKIFQIFQNEVNPKIIQINQHYEESKELVQLKAQMKNLQNETVLAEHELKLKQAYIQQLQIRRNNLASSIADMKKKSQIK